MKRYGSIPTALAFIGFVIVAVGCFFIIRNFVADKDERSRIEEANEVGDLGGMKVNINGNVYNAITYNSKATKIFMDEFPVEVEMEYDGDFKSGYTYFKLPVEHANIRHIKTGDILILDDAHIGIATRYFDTTERYTLIGHIENLDRLPSGKILVTFLKNE